MTDRRIVGVDPGGRHTGIVVRSRSGLHFVTLVVRADRAKVPDGAYVNACVDAVSEAVAIAEAGADEPAVLGVEEVAPPGGYDRGAQGGKRRHIDPAALIGVSMVFGAVLAVFPTAIVVPRGGNGSAPLRAYPRDLIGGAHNQRWPHAEPKGEGVLQHARSAWDVAGQVPALARLKARAS